MDECEFTKIPKEKKPKISLVPMEAVVALAIIFTYNAKSCGGKHPDYGWEKNLDWSVPFDSLNRHLLSWWQGEDKDPESGYSHLFHAIANCAILLALEQRASGTDNRKRNK